MKLQSIKLNFINASVTLEGFLLTAFENSYKQKPNTISLVLCNIKEIKAEEKDLESMLVFIDSMHSAFESVPHLHSVEIVLKNGFSATLFSRMLECFEKNLINGPTNLDSVIDKTIQQIKSDAKDGLYTKQELADFTSCLHLNQKNQPASRNRTSENS